MRLREMRLEIFLACSILAATTASGAQKSISAQPTAKKITRADITDSAAKRDFERHPKVALVVGIGDYPAKSGLSHLNFAASDAEEMASTLKQQDYEVYLLKNEQALRGDIRRALKQLSNAIDPDSGTFLFYFSGHGFAVDNVNYLATYGTTVDELKEEGLALPDVEKMLKDSKAKRQLMFVDACRNDPTVGGKSVSTPSFIDERKKKLELSEGLHVLYSTKAGTVSYETPDLQQGVFTYYLLKGLRGEASGFSRDDQHGDGMVTFADVSEYITANMRKYGVEHGQVQIPYDGGEASGDFLLADKNLPSPPKRPVQMASNNNPVGSSSGSNLGGQSSGNAYPQRPITSQQYSNSPAGNPPPVGNGNLPAPQTGIGSLRGMQGRLDQLPNLWINTATNQIYTFRFDSSHLYIQEGRAGGRIVADLALKPDKNGGQRYVGRSSLSSCPGGGQMEVTHWEATRIEARIEALPSASNNAALSRFGIAPTAPRCGGLLGHALSMVPASFIPAQ